MKFSSITITITISTVIALGPKPVLMRNQGPAGYQPAEFPFVEGEALSGATFRVVPDTKGFDILITYAARNAVLYRDKLQGNYTAELIAVPQKATNVAAADLNNDGWIDVVYAEQDGTHIAWNRNGKFEPAAAISSARSAFTFADLENRGDTRHRVRTRGAAKQQQGRVHGSSDRTAGRVCLVERRAISTTMGARTLRAERSSS